MAASRYATTTIIADEQFLERQRLFEDFLSSDRVYGDHDYRERIGAMLKAHERRLTLNINDLRQANPEMAKGLLQSPLEWLPPLEMALREVAASLNDPSYNYDLSKVQQLHVGLEGSFGALHTTPRHLSSALLSHTVCLDGIITSCSLVRPKLLRSVHYSEARKAFLMREYWDATMLGTGGHATTMNYPTSLGSGEDAALTSEFGLCSYRDYQTVSMQEMPEKAPAGQLPRTVDVILDDDLVDCVKPGDRVQIVGVYKSLSTASMSVTIPASFRAVLIALHVRLISSGAQQVSLSPDDLQNIKTVSRRRDLFELLSHSLAPSIYGHAWVKKAVLLMLLGGVEKNLANGTHLRGDINLMLVGDPSTAKSQMLRFVLSLAPLAIATTGRGSSGVGLTAAVTTDRETGERRLEAGAMVLADRGIVCIDEFDKMSDMDRVAIHEVMEQQTVTIAKAGIHASLNARCAVLAAANPIWGQYRETASPQENIRLPDSLLSRFDLLFIILDKTDPHHDRQISSHVLKMHRFIPAGLAEGEPINDSALFAPHEGGESEGEDDERAAAQSSSGATAVFQKHYGRSSGAGEGGEAENDGAEEEEEEDDDEILTLAFLKKYIYHARSRPAPVLTKGATDYIVTSYAEFRQKRDAETAHGNSEARTFPVTPRTLETLIRLATAHAKARLSARIEKKDAKVAKEMIEFCLYKEVKKKPSKRRKAAAKRAGRGGNDDDGSEATDSDSNADTDDDDLGHSAPGAHLGGRATAAKDTVPPSLAPMEGLSLEEIQPSSIQATPHRSGSQVSGRRTSLFGAGDARPSQATTTATLHDSLPGTFVDPSQETPLHATASAAATQLVRPSEEGGRAVRAALHRLRSASTSAVFATTVEQVHAEIGKEDPAMADMVDAAQIGMVLEEMQRLNQVMISEGTIYII